LRAAHLAQRLLLDHQEQREHEHEDAMPQVAKHDGEQEGEGHDGEHSGVDLAVARDAVRVHDGLEAARELVGLEVRGWVVVRHGHRLQHRPHLQRRKKGKKGGAVGSNNQQAHV